MRSQLNTKTPMQWLNRLAAVAGGVAVLGGGVVLAGWAAGSTFIESVIPDWPKMAPGTAVGLILLGLSVLFEGVRRSRKGASGWLGNISVGLAGTAALLGLARLAAYATGGGSALDYLVFRETAMTSDTAWLSPLSAVNCVLLGTALCLAGQRRFARTFQVLTLCAGMVGWLGISRYSYGGDTPAAYTSMAVHTSLLWLLLSAGVLCLRTDCGLMTLLTSSSSGGLVARRLLLPALCLPFVTNWLGAELKRRGWIGSGVELTIFSLCEVLVIGALIWANGALMDRAATERRKTGESLRASQELLHGIVDSSDDAIISKDLHGVITSWNKGAEKLFGFTAEEAVGQPMLIVIPPERAQEEPEILQRVLQGDSIDHFETIRMRKDGTRIDVSATISPVKDSQGKVIGASKIARDITDRKKTDAKVLAQLARLDLLNQITHAVNERQDLHSIFQVVVRSLEDHLPIDFGCVCLYDPVANELSVATVGVRHAKLARELTASENTRSAVEQNGFSRCVQGHLIYEPEIAGADGACLRRLAENGLHALVAAPLLVEGGTFGVLLVARRQPQSFSSGECEFLRQLSEQVALAAQQTQLYDSLQRAYDDLRQSEQVVMQQDRLRALGQMASGVAHDINNAVSPIMLYVGSLLESEKNLSPKARGYLEAMERSIEDVAETIARLKDFSRQREAQATLASVRLNTLVKQVVDLTRARWSDMPQRQGFVIQMRTELAADLPEIMGAESEIREALTNLVFNAVDAMPQGGTLTLRTRVPSSADEVWLEVADSGVGMDEETRKRCLEPFFTTKGERGTGLGLAMVFGMAQRHSAGLEIESEPGRGTTIRLRFCIPVSTLMSESQAPAIPLQPQPQYLLVVDDDPLLLQSLRDILEADGHVVVTRDSGQGGIDTFRRARDDNKPFSAVITDLGMPYVDGRAVAKAVKIISPKTPVILCSGWGKRLASDGDIPADVDQLVSKPPRISDLRAALFNCCEMQTA